MNVHIFIVTEFAILATQIIRNSYDVQVIFAKTLLKVLMFIVICHIIFVINI